MSRALFTAVSGLRNFQVWLDTIGNNIANASTPGFKSAGVTFVDVLGQTISGGIAPTGTQGGINPVQVGLGMTFGSITSNFQQGSIQTTNRATDMAIQGDGFFVLANGADTTYTRAGSFTLDANGDLVDSATGYYVQGANGTINIPQGQLSAATATSTATFKGNLDSSVADGTTYTATFDELDSLGAAHTLTITFTKNFGVSAPGTWNWAVTKSASDTAITSLSAASGSIVFGATGGVSTGASQAISIAYGAAVGVTTPQSITLDFGTASNTTPMTGFASSSTVTLASQDGLEAGSLQSFSIGLDGTVTGFYSNGRTSSIDTVQIATFANPAGLVKIGTNQYRESPASGVAAVGDPNTAGRGTITAGALEMSNVDLAQEFSNMIIAERGFQANARTVTTADQMLQELVDMKR
jgi:flagellar hook protein FlgE